MQHANEMGVFNETNAVLRAFGITVVPDSNRIVVGVRSCPRIRYANNQIVTPNPDLVSLFYCMTNIKFLSCRPNGARLVRKPCTLRPTKFTTGLFCVIIATGASSSALFK